MALVAAGLLGLLVVPASALAKKGSRVNATKQVNQQVPDRANNGSAPFGLLTSTIRVGNKFVGKRVRDVNVTVQTTGSENDAASDPLMTLTAPNGATTTLIIGLSGQSIGPLTFDDESPLHLSGSTCVDPTGLCAPYLGSAEPVGELVAMDNGRVRGTWTLKVLDLNAGATSILNSWRLNVVAGNPYRSK